MASLVLLSFLSDLVMLFCIRKCLFLKLDPVPSYMHILFLSLAMTDLCMLENYTSLIMQMMDAAGG